MRVALTAIGYRCGVIAQVGLAAAAFGQPVVNPANCHAYEAVDGIMTWEEARLAAAARSFGGVQGHLATFTSAAETEFVFNAFGPRGSFAIGGLQPPGSPEPDGGWTWITGEVWDYTNWNSGEPNNATIQGQTEDRLAWSTGVAPKWNDVARDVNQGPGPGQYRMNGYFVEYPAPCCYANCDGSTVPPILNVSDFTCFLNKFAAGDSYANCDGSTTPPILNVNDFICFQTRFAAGCP